MVNSLVISILLFGAPLFACLSNNSMVMTACSRVFRDVEDFGRDMLRWALRAPRGSRNSVLYVVSNSASVQLLCHKACWRFFHSLEQHPRAASATIRSI